MHKITPAHQAPRYRPYTIALEMRKLSAPIRLNGKKMARYPAPIITEYVDMETGEIISAAALKDSPELWPTIRSSERAMQREFILQSLRKEVRAFALFVLAFRNQRRGMTPGVDQLVCWYAVLTGKRASNIRRYVKPLTEAGVIAGSSLLGPLFQITGQNTKMSEHLGEDAKAAAKFLITLTKNRAQAEFELSVAPDTRSAGATLSKSAYLLAHIHELVEALERAGRLQPMPA